ncbi:MAG: hypothetical protein KGZ96_08925 [Clostridia bacterium]|nr:hypothetical protein [Clostridia bacterium]
MFEKEFLIPYFHTDKDGYLRFPIILAYMAETSSWHSDSIGVGINELINTDLGWMLNKWEVKVESYPKSKEVVVVNTWTSDFNRFYATREFVMKDSSGNVLAVATTQWILINMTRKRPVRIPEDFIEKYKRIKKTNFEHFTDLNLVLDNISLTSKFTVRRSDIDNNNHVNNIRYIEWVIEDVEDDLYKDMKIQEFAIIYKKEILEGSLIETGHTRKEEKLIHKITTSGEVNAIAMTKWKKKD